MDKIPKEVLGIIFSFLSERFRRYIEVTCKEWTNLIRNDPHIISSKIRDLSQYFSNSSISSFPTLDKVKEIGVVITDDITNLEFIRKLIQLPNVKIMIFVNPEVEKVLHLLIDCKTNIIIVKQCCFICNHTYTINESHMNRGGNLWGIYENKTICILCKRGSYCYCLDELVKKTCGKRIYCYDCIDIVIAMKRVVICKKCDGYFDISNNNNAYCKDCGVLTSCFKNRCVKCKQEVCKACQSGPFCFNCLYMCTNCKKVWENLVRCKVCRVTRYCSEECQEVDLEKHTPNCTLHLNNCKCCGKQNNRQFDISYHNRYNWNALFLLGYQMSRNQTKFTMRCSRCKMVSYCSKICQNRDWKRHKEHCFKL